MPRMRLTAGEQPHQENGTLGIVYTLPSFKGNFYSRIRQVVFPCETHFSRIRLSPFSYEASYRAIHSFPETGQPRYFRSQLSINMHLRSDDRAKGQIGLRTCACDSAPGTLRTVPYIDSSRVQRLTPRKPITRFMSMQKTASRPLYARYKFKSK